MYRRRLLGVALALGGGLAAFEARAQSSTTKPIRILVGNPPGGLTDIYARVIAEGITSDTGRTVIVDNKPGAGGLLASQALMEAPADGSTLMLATGASVITPLLQKKPSLDAITDFTPVSLLAAGGSLLMVHSSVPVANLAEFVAFARKNPGKLNYASNGPGSSNHLMTEYLKASLGIDLTHVPYKGGAPSTLALRSGEVQVLIIDQSNAGPLLKDGSARAVAQTGLKRAPDFPTIPTLNETLAPGFNAVFWMAIVAPKNTPSAVVDTLNPLINAQVLRLLKERSRAAGLDVAVGPPSALGDLIKEESAKWSAVIRRNGIMAD